MDDIMIKERLFINELKDHIDSLIQDYESRNCQLTCANNEFILNTGSLHVLYTFDHIIRSFERSYELNLEVVT